MRGRRHRIPKALVLTLAQEPWKVVFAIALTRSEGRCPATARPRPGHDQLPPRHRTRAQSGRPSARWTRNSVLWDLVSGLDDLIQVLLERPLLITDEAEDMVEREPLDVGWILVQIGPDTVQLGEDFFRFHGEEAYHGRDRKMPDRRGRASIMPPGVLKFDPSARFDSIRFDSGVNRWLMQTAQKKNPTC